MPSVLEKTLSIDMKSLESIVEIGRVFDPAARVDACKQRMETGAHEPRERVLAHGPLNHDR